MDATIKVQIRQDVKTESEWIEENPIIPKNHIVFSSDRGNLFKIGNGESHWIGLEYNHSYAIDVYEWAKNSHKPVYTKSEVGLGNVDNKSSEQIRSELTKDNVETALNGSLDLNTLTIGGHAQLSYDKNKNGLKISFI